MAQEYHSKAVAEHSTVNEKQLEQQKETIEKLLFEKYEPIAIVGIGLDLPGDNRSPSQFSAFLRSGKDGIRAIPEDRWDVNGLYSADAGARGKIRTHSGGYLESIDRFDPRFFNISPKEAAYIDPQQRMVLEASWKALEHANIDPFSLADEDGGVYVGVSSMDYILEADSLAYEAYEGYIGTGTSHSAVSGRVSFFLGWRGPSVSIDTACSSSLVALDQAVQGLRRRECNIALCGGVNAIHYPYNMIVLSQANMLAPDGKCKTFDDSADGYGRSEGCGMIVLKRLSEAQRDGDRILALIRGAAVRQDGESGGLTVPNGVAQAKVMRSALRNSLLNPGEIQYVEAHGTGTSLGDPIEIGAINEVFNQEPTGRDPIIVGSVKTNIGHLEAAAGIGGVIKVALQLYEGILFPHIHFHTPSKNIPWDQYQVRIPTEPAKWETSGVRRAIVNSFGFSGTIATAVLEQAPAAEVPTVTSNAPASIFTISAKTRSALTAAMTAYAQQLEVDPKIDIADFCYTTNLGRAHFPHRAALNVDSREVLTAWLDKQAGTKDQKKSPKSTKVAFLFTGQGSQYSGMGYGLYRHVEVFRETVDECDALFRGLIDASIKKIMFDGADENAQRLARTQFTQPALFTLEFALARLLRHWGIEPSILIGHSIGEIVAATVAGLFTLPDAAKIVATRARLMQSVKAAGGMLAVRSGANEVIPFLKGRDDIALAALNAPNQCVVSGAEEALKQVGDALARQKIECVRLSVSHAFHSPLMGEVYEEFRGIFNSVCFNPLKLPMISNLSGEVARYDELCDPDYWVRHIGQPVLFEKGIQALAQRGKHAMLELGPSPALSGLAKQTIDAADYSWVHFLKPKQDDVETTARAICDLYESGLNLDWEAYHEGRLRKVDLPYYAFEKKPYWLPVKQRHARATADAATHPLLGREISSPDARIRVFRQTISTESPAYLADHVVLRQVVFPGAAYMEMLIALQDHLHGEFAGQIADVLVSEPLFLSDEPVQLVTTAEVRDDATVRVLISSRLPGNGHDIERTHVTARILPTADPVTRLDEVRDKLAAFAEIRTADKSEFHRDEVYYRFESLGLRYGPAFQRILGLRKLADDVVLGQLQSLEETGQEFLHPSLLDCAVQCLIGLVEDENQSYLPVRFERFQFHKKPRGALWSIVQTRPPADGDIDLSADVVVLDDDRPVFTLGGLGLKRVSNTDVPTRQLFHEPRWVKRSPVASQQAISNSHHILLVGATREDAQVCSGALATSELRVSVAETLESALETMSNEPSIDGLCYFWRTHPGDDDVDTLKATCRLNYQVLLHLVKGLDALLLTGRNLRLWLVTEGGQWLPGDKAAFVDTASLGASTLWGFGLVLFNEIQSLRTTLIDLPARGPDAGLYVEGLAEEWRAWDAEPSDYQIAYRGNSRYVRRIVQTDHEREKQSGNFELQIAEYGLFDNIRASMIEDVVPQGDQVQIEMRAVGLNFKDVLNALGLLKKHAEEEGLEYQALPLGFEGSGVVVACGDDAEFRVGDEVIVSYLGCMKRRLTVSSLAAVKKPSNLDFDQAAALPTAYITAYYALHELAKIKAGERILIHAAAGGVGQAAVQLAHAVGAEVFATASPAKWAHLKSQGVRHLMNSRTPDFATEVNNLTGGKGVDVVLNSLNGNYIPENLSCLGEQGRFVELGKIGIWSQERMRNERPDVAYYNFDLSEFPEERLLRLNHDILEQVAKMIEGGQVRPLPITSYTLDEVSEAFGVLSRGANIGKLTLRIGADEEASKPFVVDDTHCYLITGGYGALGKVLVSKLAESGARHIAVASRRKPSEEELAEIRASLKGGVSLYPLQADVCEPAHVDKLFGELAAIKVPLGAVFHAAGVLAEGPILKQDWDGFSKVFASKVQGSFLLHQACMALTPPPLFVGFSSVASVLGPPSQSNYAAANAFIDHLLAYRNAAGLPGLSINWGPWAGGGMAASLSEQQKKGLEEKGVKFLVPQDALHAMWRRLGHPGPQSMICEFDWSRYVAELAVPNALYETLVDGREVTDPGLSLEELAAMPTSERETIILEFLCDKVAKVLRFDNVDQVDRDAKFSDLGLDSLVAVELKNALEAVFRFSLPSSLVSDYPSLPVLAAYLTARLEPGDSPVSGGEDKGKSVAGMNEAEVDEQLAALAESV